jgi:hypothetical protein
MAINQVSFISPHRPDQPAAKPKKTPMEQILEGLDIANGVLGIGKNVQDIREGSRNIDLKDKQLAELDRQVGSDSAEEIRKAEMHSALLAKVKAEEEARRTPLQRAADPIAERKMKLDEDRFAYQKERDARFARAPVAKPEMKSETKAPDTNPGGRPVASEVAQKIGNYDAAMAQTVDLEKAWKEKTGLFSGITQYLPGTDAAQYNDSQDLAAQDIGQIVEGGKLTNDDYYRYKSMMPTAGDSEERAAEKFERLRNYIAQRKQSAIEGARQAGYNTSGFKAVEKPQVTLKRGSDGTAIAAPFPGRLDPQIESYAKQHGLDYQTAKSVLSGRGYKANE